MKILVADDHAVVRKGLIQYISESELVTEIEEAENGLDVISKVNSADFDLLILDISMPDRNGLDILKDLKVSHPKLPVLILSTYPEELFAIRALREGASGYLNKNSAPEKLSEAITKIASGRKYISASIADSLLNNVGGEYIKLPHEHLTDRELNIFRLFAEGKTINNIAENLALSNKTISTHKSNILEKMKMKSTAEMAIYCIKNNLLD